jgi:hypothetical protein
MKETADAIREKTGKSELIKPIDFAEEIKGITAGGGDGESGDWEYYDCNIEDFKGVPLYLYPNPLIKTAQVTDGVLSLIRIGSYIFSHNSADGDRYIAIAIDYSQRYVVDNDIKTLREWVTLRPNSEMAQIVAPLQSLPRITKEEFYSLE